MNKPGFEAMRGQTDERFKERGYHRLVFPTLALAKRYQERVEANCPSTVVTQRFVVNRPKH